MAKILVQFNETTSKTTSQGNLDDRMISFFTNGTTEGFAYRKVDDTFLTFSSDEHISNASNDFASSIGINWSGSATDVNAAIEEVKSSITEANEDILTASSYENNILVPIYINTGSLSLSDYQDIIDARIKYPQVGFTVILNPSSGYPLDSDPNGSHVNSDITTMIERLQGIGCRVIGYVTSLYGGTAYGYYPTLNANAAYNDTDFVTNTNAKIDDWYNYYPNIDGIFIDEFWDGFDYVALGGAGTDFKSDLSSEISDYGQIYSHAKSKGATIVIANPGVDVPKVYWDNNLSDVFILSEASTLPSVNLLSGQQYTSSDHEYINRRRKGAIIHSQTSLNFEGAYRCAKYASYYYSIEETDGGSGLTWGAVSNHIQEQAKYFSHSMKDSMVIGVQGDAFQVSPDSPVPTLSILGFYDKSGGETYALNDTSANNIYYDGLHINTVRDTGANSTRYIDFVGLGNYGSGFGGAHLRFWTNSGTSRDAVLALEIDKTSNVNVKAGSLITAANTTGYSALRVTASAAVNVTTPTSGDLWWNGTNLYFYNGSSNVDLIAAAGTDHGGLTGLSDDDHTQYVLGSGRTGNQAIALSSSAGNGTIHGSNDANGDLTLSSTQNATKGNIFIGPNNDHVNIGHQTPANMLNIAQEANLTIKDNASLGNTYLSLVAASTYESKLSFENGNVQFLVGIDGSDTFRISEQGGSGLTFFGVDNNNTVGIGHPSNGNALVNFPEATTSYATFNIESSSAVNPTTPNDGDLWYNGTNLYFYNGLSNKDLLGTGTGDIVNGGQTGSVDIGTTDANAFFIRTNNSIRIQIPSTGEIDILSMTGSYENMMTLSSGGRVTRHTGVTISGGNFGLNLGASGANGRLHVKDTSDHIVLQEDGGTANETKWVIKAENDQLQIGVLANDAFDSFGSSPITVKRTANNIDEVLLTADDVKTTQYTLRGIHETFPFSMANTTLNMNTDAYYHKVYMNHSMTVTSMLIYCNSVGADATLMDARIYNSAGTSLASLSSTVTSTAGIVTLTFSSTVDLTADTEYWVAVSGDPGTSNYYGINDGGGLAAIGMREVLGSPYTLPTTLPSATANANRLWIKLI